MKKTLLVISSLFLSGVNAEQIENPHDDYILNAPDYLATIPTEFSNQFATMVGQTFRAETAYLYNNDVTKPFRYIDYSLINESSKLIEVVDGESFPHPDEYMHLVKAYHDANAFEARRLKKQINEVYNKEARERFSLERVVKDLQENSNKISTEANNLANALKGNSKKQGEQAAASDALHKMAVVCDDNDSDEEYELIV